MRTGKLFAGLAMAGILTGGSAFGQILVEDFNSGVFVPGSSRVITDNAYTWNGPDDSLDGWTVVDGWYSGGPAPAGYPIRLDGSPDMSQNSVIIGANDIDGGSWTSTDGNIGGYHQRFNDLPKGAWTFATELTPEMGGARDANGNALAFTVIYDAELIGYNSGIVELDSEGTPTGATQQGRGWLGSISASLVLEGQSHNANSPIFVWKDNQHHGNQNLPAEYFDVSEFEPAVKTMGEADNWGWAWEWAWFDTDDSAASAVRGVTPGVIEQTVANGATIEFRARVGRTDFAGRAGGEWHYMALGLDNLKLVALEAGDVNGDLNVNSSDIAAIIQAGTFNTGVPATWSTGDFTGDGVVTSADIAAIIQAGQFNAGPYAALNTDNSNLVEPVGELPYLEIDLDGSAVMTTNMPGNQGFQIISPAGTLTGTADVPAGVFLTNTDEEASILFQQVPDVLELGMLVADLDGFIADLAAGNVTFRVANATATGFVEGNVFVVPEPASLALLGLGGLALLRRRSA